LALDVENLENKLHLDTLFFIANSFNSKNDVVNVSDTIDKADGHHNAIYDRVRRSLTKRPNTSRSEFC
jgi:hypothetical protein